MEKFKKQFYYTVEKVENENVLFLKNENFETIATWKPISSNFSDEIKFHFQNVEPISCDYTATQYKVIDICKSWLEDFNFILDE